MCVVSMITEHYIDKWRGRDPGVFVFPQVPVVPLTPGPAIPILPLTMPAKLPISQEEVDEFRRLLERAREYDKRNNEPDCELDEKKRQLKDLAEKLGVKIDFL